MGGGGGTSERAERSDIGGVVGARGGGGAERAARTANREGRPQTSSLRRCQLTTTWSRNDETRTRAIGVGWAGGGGVGGRGGGGGRVGGGGGGCPWAARRGGTGLTAWGRGCRGAAGPDRDRPRAIRRNGHRRTTERAGRWSRRRQRRRRS